MAPKRPAKMLPGSGDARPSPVPRAFHHALAHAINAPRATSRTRRSTQRARHAPRYDRCALGRSPRGGPVFHLPSFLARPTCSPPHFADLRARRSRLRVVGTGRYPPQPKFEPFAFYSCFRLSDPEQLRSSGGTTRTTDPGQRRAPRALRRDVQADDMLHHILRNCPSPSTSAIRAGSPHTAPPTSRSTTATSRSTSTSPRADPSLRTDDFDPYLDPGTKLPVDVAIKDDATRDAIRPLRRSARASWKKPEPHADIGDWWAPRSRSGDGGRMAQRHKPEYPERRRTRSSRRRNASIRPNAAAREVAIAEEVAKLVVSASPLGAGGADARAAKLKRRWTSTRRLPWRFCSPGRALSACAFESIAHVPEVRSMCDRAFEFSPSTIFWTARQRSSRSTTRRSRNPRCSWLVSRRRRNCERTPRTWCVGALASRVSLRRVHRARVRRRDVVEDGFEWSRRARSMKAAAAAGDRGMLRQPADDAAIYVEDAKRHLVETDDGSDVDNLVCEVANYLFPQGRVCPTGRRARGGDQAAVAAGALKCAPVAESSVSHLADGLRDALVEALATSPFPRRRFPRIPPPRTSSTASEIPKLWPNSSPFVLWLHRRQPRRGQRCDVQLAQLADQVHGLERLQRQGRNSRADAVMTRVDPRKRRPETKTKTTRAAQPRAIRESRHPRLATYDHRFDRSPPRRRCEFSSHRSSPATHRVRSIAPRVAASFSSSRGAFRCVVHHAHVRTLVQFVEILLPHVHRSQRHVGPTRRPRRALP